MGDFDKIREEFKTLKNLYEFKTISLEQRSGLDENANIEVVNNGASGHMIDCDWFTASLLNFEGNYGGFSFDFYVSRH